MQARHLLTAATLAFGFCAAAFAADDGCRTIANGVQKCDVQTATALSRDAVAANLHTASNLAAETGCRTIANGVQKCDVPTGHERSREAVIAGMEGRTVYTGDGCRTIANGVQKCDVPTMADEARRTAAVKGAVQQAQ